MSGKEYLQQIKKIDTMIRNKSYEVKRLKELGLTVGSVIEDMSELEIERAKIIKTIEQLPEAEYDVLHKVYVQYETLQEVASDRKESRRTVDGIHGSALRRLESIINADE